MENFIDAVSHCIDTCNNASICRSFASRFKDHLSFVLDFARAVELEVKTSNLADELLKKSVEIFVNELSAIVTEAASKWSRLSSASYVREILLERIEPWRELSDLDAKILSKVDDMSLMFAKVSSTSVVVASSEDIRPALSTITNKKVVCHVMALDIRRAKEALSTANSITMSYLAAQLDTEEEALRHSVSTIQQTLKSITVEMSDAVFNMYGNLKREITHELKVMKDSGVYCDDIDLSKLTVEADHELGHGAFGVVYSGKYGGNTTVAVKSLNHLDETALKELKGEVKFMKALSRYPGIVRLYGANLSLDNGPLLVVLEMAQGTLHDALHMGNDMGLDLTLPMKLYALTSVAHAMEFVAEVGVVHRDVKPMNVLVFMPDVFMPPKTPDHRCYAVGGSEDSGSSSRHDCHDDEQGAGDDKTSNREDTNCCYHEDKADHKDHTSFFLPRFKMTDFGLAKRGAERSTATLNGTLQYMAPELLAAGTALLGVKTDVYAFGISMNEILTEEVPFDGLDRMQIIHAVASRGQRPRKYEPSSLIDGDSIGGSLRSLIDCCLAGLAADRPTFREIAAHLRRLTIAYTESFLHTNNSNNSRSSNSSSSSSGGSSIASTTGITESTEGVDGVTDTHTSPTTNHSTSSELRYLPPSIPVPKFTRSPSVPHDTPPMKLQLEDLTEQQTLEMFHTGHAPEFFLESLSTQRISGLTLNEVLQMNDVVEICPALSQAQAMAISHQIDMKRMNGVDVDSLLPLPPLPSVLTTTAIDATAAAASSPPSEGATNIISSEKAATSLSIVTTDTTAPPVTAAAAAAAVVAPPVTTTTAAAAAHSIEEVVSSLHVCVSESHASQFSATTTLVNSGASVGTDNNTAAAAAVAVAERIFKSIPSVAANSGAKQRALLSSSIYTSKHIATLLQSCIPRPENGGMDDDGQVTSPKNNYDSNNSIAIISSAEADRKDHAQVEVIDGVGIEVGLLQVEDSDHEKAVSVLESGLLAVHSLCLLPTTATVCLSPISSAASLAVGGGTVCGRNVGSLVRAGVGNVIVSMLKSRVGGSSASVCAKACRALALLSSCSGVNKGFIVAAGACEAVLNALLKHGLNSPAVAEPACAALSLLTAGDDSDDTKVRIGAAGGCELLVSILTEYGNASHPAIVEKASAAIYNLASRSPLTKDRLVKAGAKALLTSLSTCAGLSMKAKQEAKDASKKL